MHHRWFQLMFLKAVIFLLAAFIPFAEISPTVAQSDLTSSVKSEKTDLFRDNTATFAPDDASKVKITNLISSKLQKGYETFNLPLIESILTSDFERRYLINSENLAVEDRQSYHAARRRWKTTQTEHRRLDYAIQRINIGEANRSAIVTALSTYKTKYFNPRYLETLLFEKADERWFLKRQLLVPLHPKRPELYDVQIFVSDSDWAEKRRFRRRMRRKGPDWFIDRFRKDSVDSISSDESWHTILFVFREPPPPGSKIRTEIEFDTASRPSKYTYRIEKNQPFFVIANKVRSGRDFPGTVTFRVFLDDTKIREKTIPR